MWPENGLIYFGAGEDEMAIWFTSDTHYGHKNIVRGISNWRDKSGCRDFDTLSAMNDALVGSINSVVQEEDTLYHLGDWSMGGFDNIVEFHNRLHCRTIHLVYGNHDHHIRKNKKGVADVFSSTHSIRIGKIAEQMMVLCHFPMLVWEDHHRGVWHLHGHSHGNLKQPGYYRRKVIDVGMDAHSEFRPFSFEEIEGIMCQRSIETIDHH